MSRYSPRKKRVRKLMEKEGSKVIENIRVPEEQFLYVLRLHAEFCDIKRIFESCKEKFGSASFFAGNVLRIKHLIGNSDYNLIVSKYRMQYLARVKDVAISHKRIRLEDLELLRNNYLDKIRKTPVDDGKGFRELAKGLNEVLMSARDEIEGKSMVFNQLNVIGDFNDKSDDELAARRDELIKQAERALIGGASGVNNNPEGIEDAQVSEPS